MWLNGNRILKILSLYVGVPAAFVTLFFTFKGIYGPASTDAQFGMLLLAGFAIFFLVFSIFQEYRFSRKARYTESMHYIFQAFRLCIEGASALYNSERAICELGRQICDQIAHAFTVITGTRCSVCIKILEEDSRQGPNGTGRGIHVTTICRDNASTKRRQQPGTIKHWLDKNTDFLIMFETITRPEGGTFFSNSLLWEQDYQNTSFEAYGGRPKDVKIPGIRYIVRGKTWNLPYKSTIGASIYPHTPKEDDRLVGFICLDSPSQNVFLKRYDIPLMRELSAKIHPMILKWTNIVSRPQGEESIEGKT